MQRFEGKVALVTGGTQGMGWSVARALVAEGASVVICGRDNEKGLRCVEESGMRDRLMFVQCDTRSAGQVADLMGVISTRFGRLDCAFNNAGVTAPRAKLGQSSISDWQRVIDINVNGTYYCLREELALMAAIGGGAIVNNCSLAGIVAIPEQAAYVASKFAVAGMTKAAAIEYARAGDGVSAVRVNAIAPGPIEGGMNSEANLSQNPEHTRRKLAVTAMQRFGTQQEVADTVLWLLSNQASYMTGAILTLDGGASAGKF